MPCFILQKGSLGPSREVCTGMYRCIQVGNKCSVLYSMKTLSTNIIKFKHWGGLNPLTPRSNLPYNIHSLSSKQVMRMLKCRNLLS